MVNTFYERASTTVRERKCRECGHKFITRQSPEHILERSTIRWPQRLTESKLVDVIPTYRLEAAK